MNSLFWTVRKGSFRRPYIWVDIKYFNFCVFDCPWTNSNNFVFDITKGSPGMIIDWIRMICVFFTIITEIYNLIEDIFKYLAVTWSISSYHCLGNKTLLVRRHQIRMFHRLLCQIHLGVHQFVSIYSRQSYWSELIC